MTTTPSPNGSPRWFDRLTVAFFCALLAAPTVDYFVRSDADRGPARELRNPAPRPGAPGTWSELLAFPSVYEAYWKDSFGLRDQWLRWHSILKVLVFGRSPDPTHVIGKDLWVFNDNFDIVANWRGVIPFDEKTLEEWRARIERRRAAVESLGGHYLFCLVPDKPHIYPEKMPDRFNRVGPARMDQLYRYMAEHSKADVLDIREDLLSERRHDAPDDDTYYPLGTHWQKRGAIAGYNAMAAHLQSRFPKMKVHPREAFQRAAAPGGDREVDKMYIGDFVPQTKHFWVLSKRQAKVLVEKGPPRYVETENPDRSLPRIVVFHDSFGQDFVDEWAESSSRLIAYATYDFDLGLLQRERPDIVVEFIVERCLVSQRPSQLSPHEYFADRPFATGTACVVLDVAQPTLVGLFGASWLHTGDDRSIELQSGGGLGSFAIELPTAARKQRLVARVEIDIDRRTKAALYWKRTGGADWSADQSVSTGLVAGHNVVYLEVPAADAPIEGLVLQPFEGAGSCALRALEIRVVGAGG